MSPRKKTELVTIDTADELGGQLDGWRQMAVNTLRAGGLSALNVDAISSSASIRRIMFRGGRFKDRESGKTHTLTTEEISAIQLIEEVQVLRDRLVEQRHGAPITLQEGILGGIRLMMLREAIVTPRWLAAPSRAAPLRLPVARLCLVAARSGRCAELSVALLFHCGIRRRARRWLRRQ